MSNNLQLSETDRAEVAAILTRHGRAPAPGDGVEKDKPTKAPLDPRHPALALAEQHGVDDKGRAWAEGLAQTDADAVAGVLERQGIAR